MDTSSDFKTPLYQQSLSRPLINQRSRYYIAKRTLDVLLSGLALLLLSPLMALIALLIALDTPGPIIFKQKRVGARLCRDNNTLQWERVDFTFYKFRTMKTDSSDAHHKAYMQALIANDQQKMKEMEGDGNGKHKLVNDKRITRVGKYLRKFSLDELPQFYNVLKGDMSLVGPRPAIPYEVEMYTPWHLRRLEAKPGITGLQQTTARYTAIFEEQVNLDIQYIETQSLGLDLRILIKTPLTIFSSQKGA
ncbi:MAG: sugar transferase [Clostridiaceae bacterium]